MTEDMAKVFFMNKLRENVEPARYEKWVRERDYPEAKKMHTIKSYQVHRVKETLLGKKLFDYVEVVEVTDVDEYKKELSSPAVKALLNEWQEYIGESTGVYTEKV